MFEDISFRCEISKNKKMCIIYVVVDDHSHRIATIRSEIGMGILNMSPVEFFQTVTEVLGKTEVNETGIIIAKMEARKIINKIQGGSNDS